MASFLNSEFQATYDIFLSFRGLDTRKKFTDHLYEALKREGFQTFRDDDEIERGEYIKFELQKAVWNSKMSVIVLSRNYATSTSCLFEIQTIIEHRKNNPDHFILPVFYEVNPGEIKEQAKKLDFGEEDATGEEVEGWSAALKEVASMAGMVSENQSNGYEARFIEEIIDVLQRKQASLRVGDYPIINPPPNSDDDHSDDPDDDHSEDPDDPDDDHSEDPDDDPDDDHSEDHDHSEDPDDPNDDHSEDPDDDYFEGCDDDYFEDSNDELIDFNQV